jgi:hypothetical protein
MKTRKQHLLGVVRGWDVVVVRALGKHNYDYVSQQIEKSYRKGKLFIDFNTSLPNELWANIFFVVEREIQCLNKDKMRKCFFRLHQGVSSVFN